MGYMYHAIWPWMHIYILQQLLSSNVPWHIGVPQIICRCVAGRSFISKAVGICEPTISSTVNLVNCYFLKPWWCDLPILDPCQYDVRRKKAENCYVTACFRHRTKRIIAHQCVCNCPENSAKKLSLSTLDSNHCFFHFSSCSLSCPLVHALSVISFLLCPLFVFVC